MLGRDLSKDMSPKVYDLMSWGYVFQDFLC